MSYNLKGKLKLIQDTQTFESGFTKREFVVTTESEYPQDIKLEFVKDKCAILDNYKVGQDVTVDFDIRGNSWEGKYYVNLSAWRIGSNSEDGNEVIGQAAKDKAKQPEPIDDVGSDFLPF